MTALHPRIAAAIEAIPEAVAVLTWCVGHTLYTALVDTHPPVTEGSPVTATQENELTVFDRLLAQGQQVKRDFDEQERLSDIARKNREATLFYNSTATERQ